MWWRPGEGFSSPGGGLGGLRWRVSFLVSMKLDSLSTNPSLECRGSSSSSSSSCPASRSTDCDDGWRPPGRVQNCGQGNMILNPQQMSGWLHLKKSDISIRENYVVGVCGDTTFAVTGTGAGGGTPEPQAFSGERKGAPHDHRSGTHTQRGKRNKSEHSALSR